MEKFYDLVIKNARVVRPNRTSVDCLDIAIKDGKVARLSPDIEAEQAKEVFDAKNLLAFPGCVDAHMHIGIYAPLAQDAVSESKAAAMGGVTSSLNYIRTGHYYLNRGGPYRDFMPEVLKQSEGLAIWIASYLANETNCLNVNLLHLSSRKAMEAAWIMQQVFPHIAFRREVTVGHLLLDADCACAVHAKVNPPIRPREDVEALWQAVLEHKVDWIVSDHACCSAEQKWSKKDPTNIWLAKAGFGGTEY